MQLMLTGQATVTGTTIRRCIAGLLAEGKATIGKGCSITACTHSGVIALEGRGGAGRVTVEGADVVCTGSNTSNHEDHGDYVAAYGTITAVAEGNIMRW